MAKKVLVVDDEPDVLKIVSFRLKSAGYEVKTASDGQEALDLIEKDCPDLILLDLRMPVMDGYEAINILKADSVLKDIPVIVLTASAMKEEQEKIDSLNCEGYLRKPIEKNKLLRELAKYLAYTGEDKTAGELKTTTGEKAGGGLTSGQRKKLPELIALMEGQLKNDLTVAAESFIIDDIKDFAARVEKLGKKYNIELVREWADKVNRQAESFDMDNLPATLDYFKGLTGKVKKLLN